MSQSPRALFASFCPHLLSKGQQEPPNACGGGPLFLKATSKWLFALRCRQENIPLFSHEWFQQGILSLYL